MSNGRITDATMADALSGSHSSRDNLNARLLAAEMPDGTMERETLRRRSAGCCLSARHSREEADDLIRHDRHAPAPDKLTPDLVFRDPYFLDFRTERPLPENDVEDAIMRSWRISSSNLALVHLRRPPKRIQVDNDDTTRPVEYHRGLRRLVAIDLNLANSILATGPDGTVFALAGRHEQHPRGSANRSDSVRGKKTEQIELLELEKSGIRVASSDQSAAQETAAAQLHEAILHARARLAADGC